MRHSSLRVLAAALALPSLAQANTGIGLGPFLPISMSLVPALVVVIPLEAAILRLILPVRFARLLWLAFLANILSTVVGAVLGFTLDFAFAMQLGLSLGIAAFVVGLLAMYAMTAWIELAVVRRKLAESPPRAVLRAILVANAVTYLLLVAWAYFVFVANDPMVHRSRMTEVVNVAQVAKTEAAEHFLANGRFRATRQEKPTVHTRRATTSEAGRITVEIDYPRLAELNGKSLVLEPELREGKLAAWHCYVPDAPLKYFPASCRYRSAAEAAAAGASRK